MDRYFNVFYSYAQGGTENLGEEKVLENNVTKALMVVLSHSKALTKEFLRRFLEKDEIGRSYKYSYSLQTTLESLLPDDMGSEDIRKFAKKHVIVIGPRADRPEPINVPEFLVAKTVTCLSDERGKVSRLRNLLIRRDMEVKDKASKASTLPKEIWQLLSKHGKEGREECLPALQSLDRDGLRYLHDLTFGSRPDAVIADSRSGLAVLFENKIQGVATDVQIRRHMIENFGEDSAPVHRCTWREVYAFLDGPTAVAACRQSETVNFLRKQFLEYLEAIDMGPLRFKQEDFLEWEEYRDRDRVRALLRRVENLGEEMAGFLGDHWVNRQNISRNYLGVNVVSNRYPQGAFQPVQVPHWSLALQQHGAEDRALRLYVQCEGSKLAAWLCRNRPRLEQNLSVALAGLAGNNAVVLRLNEKLFLAPGPGAKGKRENIWRVYWSYPLEVCSSSQDVKVAVGQAFEMLAKLQSPEHKKRVFEKLGLAATGLKGKTIIGVLQINYQLNWLEVEKLAEGISHKLEEVVRLFKPYYEALLEYHP